MLSNNPLILKDKSKLERVLANVYYSEKYFGEASNLKYLSIFILVLIVVFALLHMKKSMD
jgi:hypothetical protein